MNKIAAKSSGKTRTLPAELFEMIVDFYAEDKVVKLKAQGWEWFVLERLRWRRRDGFSDEQTALLLDSVGVCSDC